MLKASNGLTTIEGDREVLPYVDRDGGLIRVPLLDHTLKLMIKKIINKRLVSYR